MGGSGGDEVPGVMSDGEETIDEAEIQAIEAERAQAERQEAEEGRVTRGVRCPRPGSCPPRMLRVD